MNISYNGLDNPANLVTFTDVPNIVKVTDEIGGQRASFSFQFEGNLRQTVSADSQYFITFLGETISNVMNPADSKNKRFYISGDEDATAMNVARALRNCGGIAAEFNVIHKGPEVKLLAKTIGRKWSNIPNYLNRNIPNQYLYTFGTDGSASSVLYNSKIDLDVYSGSSFDDENYVTTLEKNFYGNECSFDTSQVLSTFSEYGKTVPYIYSLQLIRDDGEWQHMGNLSGNTSVGYLANQSEKYLIAGGTQILMNNDRGASGTILYTYSSYIPYTVLCGPDTGGWTVTYSCKDSAFNELYSYTQTARRTSSNYLIDQYIEIPSNIFPTTYYVDLTVGSETVRFNVIKPLKATEYYQRVQWRNEYGGLSFFDFTGARSESDTVDISTYEKNVFDYYETEAYERKRIYNNDYKKTVKLTSHLIKEDGKWIFNSLMKSKRVWTEINGKTYYIIPKQIEVVEDQTYNNIYTATLTYEYSDLG